MEGVIIFVFLNVVAMQVPLNRLYMASNCKRLTDTLWRWVDRSMVICLEYDNVGQAWMETKNPDRNPTKSLVLPPLSKARHSKNNCFILSSISKYVARWPEGFGTWAVWGCCFLSNWLSPVFNLVWNRFCMQLSLNSKKKASLAQMASSFPVYQSKNCDVIVGSPVVLNFKTTGDQFPDHTVLIKIPPTWPTVNFSNLEGRNSSFPLYIISRVDLRSSSLRLCTNLMLYFAALRYSSIPFSLDV